MEAVQSVGRSDKNCSGIIGFVSFFWLDFAKRCAYFIKIVILIYCGERSTQEL